MTVYLLDENNYYIGFGELTEENKDKLNHTTVSMTIGYIKPKFNGTEWIEGATQEEIDTWYEANKPEPQPPNEIEICMAKIAEQEEQIMLQEETTLDIDYRVTCIELGI